MNKFLKLLTLFLLIFACFFLQPKQICAAASSSNEQTDGLLGSIEEQIDQLDLEELEKYIQSLTGEKKDLRERLTEYIRGEPMDYGGFFSGLLSVLFKRIQELLPSFACIVAIALLCGVLTSLKSGETVLTSIKTIGFAASLIPALVIVGECYTATKECIEGMKTQMELVFPLLLTLLSASGGNVTAAVCQPSVAFLSASIVFLMSAVVLPITMTTIAFSLAGALSAELKLNKFTAFFKSFNKWAIGICVSVFGLFFTLQGLTAASYDSVARRAAKYAIGNGVPIIGGFLSGGFDLAMAGSVLIKNSLGTVSIFMLIWTLFEPLILLISTNLLFKLTAAITAPLGEDKISNFLSETADHLNFCSAAALFTGFLYFLCVLIFVCATEGFV